MIQAYGIYVNQLSFTFKYTELLTFSLARQLLTRGLPLVMVNNSREEAYYSDRHPGAGLF